MYPSSIGGTNAETSACNAGDPGSFPSWRRSPGEEWQLTPVLQGEFHGQRSLVGYSPWGRKEADTAEQLTHPLIHLSHFIFTFVIINELIDNTSFSGSSAGKESACDTETWVRKIPWRREWLPTPVFLPGEFHGQRSLVGYSPWHRRVGHERLSLHLENTVD